jgi:hypothetical protein
MKIRITAIILLFAATVTFNGLMAQTPAPVHGTKTDQEVQHQDEDSTDRTYNQKETKDKERWNKGKDRKTQKGANGKKDKAGQANCEGNKKGKSAHQRDRKEESHTKGLNKEELKHTMRAHKGQMNKEDRSFKKHPIFERRADARNGKGENN